MGLLDDDYKPPFTPPGERRYKSKGNFEELNNFDRKEVSEDFGDSPFADRKEEKEKL